MKEKANHEYDLLKLQQGKCSIPGLSENRPQLLQLLFQAGNFLFRVANLLTEFSPHFFSILAASEELKIVFQNSEVVLFLLNALTQPLLPLLQLEPCIRITLKIFQLNLQHHLILVALAHLLYG